MPKAISVVLEELASYCMEMDLPHSLRNDGQGLVVVGQTAHRDFVLHLTLVSSGLEPSRVELHVRRIVLVPPDRRSATARLLCNVNFERIVQYSMDLADGEVACQLVLLGDEDGRLTRRQFEWGVGVMGLSLEHDLPAIDAVALGGAIPEEILEVDSSEDCS